MTYDDFLERMKQDLEDRFQDLPETGPDIRMDFQEVRKVQGESYRGIAVSDGDSPVKAVFNLESSYQMVESGRPYGEVLQQTAEDILQAIEKPPAFRLADLTDYDAVRSSLMMELIPQKGNEDMLAGMPHQKVEDLALIYRVDMEQISGDHMSMMITDQNLKAFGITAGQLHQDAMENAPLSHPPVLKSLREVLAGLGMGGMEPSPGEPDIMVATTEDAVMGASVIQYPGFLEQAAEKIGGDFFVLPSSIHEVLLVPDDGVADYHELETMVRGINKAQVAPKERLSDHVYHYDQDDRVFELASKNDARNQRKALEGKEQTEEIADRKTSVLAQLGEKKKEAMGRAPKAKTADRSIPEAAI